MRSFSGTELTVSFLGALLLPYTLVKADATCYAPDRVTRAKERGYVPCNSYGIEKGNVSMCCLLAPINDDWPRDVCDPSGLCINQGKYFRDYCTDPTWNSPYCLNVCSDVNSGGSSNGTVELTKCPDGTFCCGTNNTTCCGTGSAVSIPATMPVLAATPSIVSTVIISSTAIVTSTAGASSQSGSTSGGSSSNVGAMAGLGAALGVVVLASLCAVFFLLRRLKKSNTERAPVDNGDANKSHGASSMQYSQEQHSYPSASTYPPNYSYPPSSNTPNVRYEADGRTPVAELEHQGIERK